MDKMHDCLGIWEILGNNLGLGLKTNTSREPCLSLGKNLENGLAFWERRAIIILWDQELQNWSWISCMAGGWLGINDCHCLGIHDCLGIWGD